MKSILMEINRLYIYIDIFRIHVFFTDEAIILFLNLSVVLHESGTINVLLAPWLNKTEVYLTPFISTQNHTIAE
jgi:hypothetical protein